MKKLHIKKGDTVYVNAGNDKGKTGKVLSVDPSKDRAIVEGINMVSKHTKPNSKQPQGGIIRQEAPIHVSNLNLIDPKTNTPTRFMFQISTSSIPRPTPLPVSATGWRETRRSVTLKNQGRRLNNYGKEKRTGSSSDTACRICS